MRVSRIFLSQVSQKNQRSSRFLRRSRRPFYHYFISIIFTAFLTFILSSAKGTTPAWSTEVNPTSEVQARQLTVAAPLQGVEAGRDRYRNGQFTAAIALWQEALEAFTAQGDRLNQAMVLNNLSLAYQDLGQWSEAEQAIASCLKLLPTLNQATSVERLRVEAQALNNQGRLQLAQGKTDSALTSWQQATKVYQQLKDTDAVTWSLLDQSKALRALGFYQQASQVLAQASQLLEAQPNSTLKVEILRNLGEMWQATGDLKQSEVKLRESLAIARQLQSTVKATPILLSLGNTAWLSQQPDAALSYYQQAITESSNAIAALPAQLNQLHLLIETEQWQLATELWPPIQTAIVSAPANRTNIYAQINFAQSLLKLRKQANSPTIQTIAPILARAIQQARQISDSQAESYALGYLGSLYEQTQQLSEAQELTEQALLLAQLHNVPNIAYRWQWQLGRLLKAQADNLANTQPGLTNQQQTNYDQAIAAYTEAIATLNTLRGDLVTTNLDMQFSFRESVEPVYRELVSLLLLQPDQTLTNQGKLEQARQVIESLQLAELDNYFREACLNVQAQLADRVDPQAAVVYPIILPNRLEVILSLPNQPLRHYTTAIAQSELETIIAQTRQALRPTSSLNTRLSLSQQLYDLLLRPAEADLINNDIKTLAFVLDGSLRNIPMAMLYDGQQYVIERYSVALTPSLQLMQPKPLASQKLSVLMGGLTEARDQFSPLPGVEVEVKGIQAEVPSRVLFNQTFNTQNFSKEMMATSFPVVHLATHGQFSSNAEDTFVLMWDQRLSVKQLGELLQSRDDGARSPIELLVLSACQTAAGDNRATLGLAGLAVRSGARSTLATLWSVDDAATSSFMVQFYKEIAQGGMTKAEAVRKAQLSLLKQPDLEHPYYWAPFVLVGNWL